MKKHFLFSILFCAFLSCQEDVKFNNPTFEGKKEGVLWRAVDTRATLAVDGSLTIDAYTGKEIVTLKTSSALPETYPLGLDTSNMVTYLLTDAKGIITFSTGADIGEGEIVIEEYDAINKTVSGTFKFNVENIDDNPLFGPTLNFQYGKFYKVPVTKLTL